MILEQAILQVKPDTSAEFEAAFKQASSIISQMKGFLSVDLLKCIEKENNYLLLVKWETLEDHEVGFRQSKEYQQWKQLLHHFYEPFPEVFHYETILTK